MNMDRVKCLVVVMKALEYARDKHFEEGERLDAEGEENILKADTEYDEGNKINAAIKYMLEYIV